MRPSFGSFAQRNLNHVLYCGPPLPIRSFFPLVSSLPRSSQTPPLKSTTSRPQKPRVLELPTLTSLVKAHVEETVEKSIPFR